MKYAPMQIANDSVFGDYRYLDPLKLYMSYYSMVPSTIQSNHLSVDAVLNYMDKHFDGQISNMHSREYATVTFKMVRNVVVYVLSNQVMVYVETDHFVKILYTSEQEEFSRDLLKALSKFKRKKEKNSKISMVTSGPHGLDTTDLTIPKPKLSFSTHYNEDLKPTHDTIMSFIKQKQQSGLVLLHGEPGTGKSTYIRYLIRSTDKKVIFLPPGLAGNLDAPSFTSFLIENANTVFVIEDAEELITSRESGRNSSISMILNLTDGLLGESLGIKIIATFNTDIRKIDKALLRKGRLIALYEFKKLETERSKILLSTLGHKDVQINHSLSLAEIYNYGQSDILIDPPRPQIGFLANAV